MKFKKFSPSTGELVQEYTYSSQAEVEKALVDLHAGFESWKKLGIADRQTQIAPLAKRLTEKKSIFAETISHEMGKLYSEAVAEVEKCIKTIEHCVKMDLSFLKSTVIQSAYKESEISYQPLGIIYSIMPWNFPLWQAIRMIIPGVLSGNVILLKHSEVSPETGRLIEELFDGIFEKPILKHRLAPHDFTEMILADERVQGVSITGSTKAGLSVSALAAKYLKKSVLELGGSDPYIVYKDADLKLSAKMIAKSRLQNTGQSCIAAKRCLVDASVLPDFMDLLKKEFSDYEFGQGRDLKASLGCLADVRFKTALYKQLQSLKANTDAELVFEKHHGQSEKSAFVNSQIYLLKENSPWLKDQEFFAPVMLVLPFESNDQSIQIANSTIYGLGAGVFSQNLAFAKQQAQAIEAGQVAINDLIKSDVTLPFGGVKMSGWGRELANNGFMEFTEMKVISYS